MATEATAKLLTVKVTVVEPPGTVTLVGTEAFGLSDFRLTTTPPAAAGSASSTVAVEVVPPGIDVGLRLKLLMNGVPIA